MRLPRVEEWSAAGDPTDGVGFITYRQIPIHWWLLNRWLTFVHPHWGWWYRLWGRILPYWGDPFCAAYTIVWSRFYESRKEDSATVEIGWDGLPQVLKAAIRSRRNEDENAVEHTRAAVPDLKHAQPGAAGPRIVGVQ